jgi:hypothetical protein
MSRHRVQRGVDLPPHAVDPVVAQDLSVQCALKPDPIATGFICGFLPRNRDTPIRLNALFKRGLLRSHDVPLARCLGIHASNTTATQVNAQIENLKSFAGFSKSRNAEDQQLLMASFI